MLEIKEWRSSTFVATLGAGENEGFASQASPYKDLAAVGKLKKDALLEKPFRVGAIEVKERSKSSEITFAYSVANREELATETLRFLSVQQLLRRETT